MPLCHTATTVGAAPLMSCYLRSPHCRARPAHRRRTATPRQLAVAALPRLASTPMPSRHTRPSRRHRTAVPGQHTNAEPPHPPISPARCCRTAAPDQHTDAKPPQPPISPAHRRRTVTPAQPARTLQVEALGHTIAMDGSLSLWARAVVDASQHRMLSPPLPEK